MDKRYSASSCERHSCLKDYGYEVLSYKKKYTYYYVVNRPLDTAEVVLIADALKSSKLTPRQKNELIGKLSNLLCCHQAESISKHLISFDGEKRSRSSIIYNVDVIERAIDENKQVSFLYFDYNEKHEKVYRKNGGLYYEPHNYGVGQKQLLYVVFQR